MTAGRPRDQQPAMAWDYRRVKALVDVLALDERAARKGLKQLCKDWGIPMTKAWSIPYIPSNPNDEYITEATIRALARHALEYSRTQPAILPDCAGDLVDEYPEDM